VARSKGNFFKSKAEQYSLIDDPYNPNYESKLFLVRQLAPKKKKNKKKKDKKTTGFPLTFQIMVINLHKQENDQII